MQLKQYHGVFCDLWTSDGVILKGCQIIIPKFLRANVIGLAHEGHQHAEKTLNLLRQGSWFPKTREDVLDYVQSCNACLSAVPQVATVPMQSNLLPECPWQYLNADFMGPIGGEFCFHIVIDQYSKYSEVDIVSSTSFKSLRPKLDRIFSGNGNQR